MCYAIFLILSLNALFRGVCDLVWLDFKKKIQLIQTKFGLVQFNYIFFVIVNKAPTHPRVRSKTSSKQTQNKNKETKRQNKKLK